MIKILLVTGNSHKLDEWQRIMAGRATLSSVNLDLIEIQSDILDEIVADKARRAFDQVKKPIVVEDVAAGLDELNGLPGPFIKFFIGRLGQDALYKLANKQDGAAATASCSAAYYDGENLIMVRSDVHGTIVSPRGDSMFGFDVTFIPDGYTQTYAEMNATKKNAISHRAAAAKLLLAELEKRAIV